jgi:hypothetical protein
MISSNFCLTTSLDASSCSDYESIDSAAVPITELLNRLKSTGVVPSCPENVVYAVSDAVADNATTDNPETNDKEMDGGEEAELEVEQTLIHSSDLSKSIHRIIGLLFLETKILILFCPLSFQ